MQVRDAQQDSQPAVRPAAGVLLSSLWHVPEASQSTSRGDGEAHQPDRPPQAGKKRRGAEGTLFTV